MAKNNQIVEIEGSDLISESMHKINDNFHILAEAEEQDRYKWESYVNSVKSEIESLKKIVDNKNIEISQNISDLDNKINDIPTLNNIQSEVAFALENASGALGDAIRALAGQQVADAMGGYAKKSYVDGQLNNYVTNTVFTAYKSNAAEKTGTFSTIAANSKFYTEIDESTQESYLVWLNGTMSQYKTINDFYKNGLTTEEKNQIDPQNKGLSDTDVLNRFIALCEKKFKTVATELAGIQATVGDGTAQVDILAEVEGENGQAIAAGIFVQANKNGSAIKLNADCLNLTGNLLVIDTDNLQVNKNGDGKVAVKGKIEATEGKIGNLNIDTTGALNNGDNFTLTASGLLQAKGVDISGDITATSLRIKSGSETKTLENFIKGVGHNEGWDSEGGGSSGDGDGWLTEAFQETSIEGGILLTGNMLVGDKNGTVTAGVLGGDVAGTNDLRFFAGNGGETGTAFDNRENAPFRVYEDGSFYASDAHISGEITLHPEYHFNNGYYQEDYTGTIHFGEQGLNMSAANVNLGNYAFIHGFKEHITFFDPYMDYKRNGTCTNTYNETLDDDFIICGKSWSPAQGPNSGNITVNLYFPIRTYLDNGGYDVENPPIWRVLKILATSSSVVISNANVPIYNYDNTRRIKISKSNILYNKSDENTTGYSFAGVDSVTITAGQMAYVYTLDRSPEEDDPVHLGWFVHIVG